MKAYKWHYLNISASVLFCVLSWKITRLPLVLGRYSLIHVQCIGRAIIAIPLSSDAYLQSV